MDSHSSYPPPPGPDQQSHPYNPIYAAAVAAQQQLNSAPQHDHLNYQQHNASPYPKIEPALDASLVDPATNGRVEPPTHANQVDQRPPPITPAPTSVPLHQPSTTSPVDPSQPKTNRLRKACDSCSIRKVKCDESGPPCKACAALEIPCTFDRPSRRRGPPNRHAEAIKKRRLESPTGGAVGVFPSASASPTQATHATHVTHATHAAQALAALSYPTNPSTLSVEHIAPLDFVELLINDFFTYIHPLCPFPHEPSFRAAFSRREDMHNKQFLALLATMIGSLVASYPRKPREHLKALHKEDMFSNHMALVERCQAVCSGRFI